MTDVTAILSQFVAEATFAELPDDAVQSAKKLILDCVGVMLAGSTDRPSLIVAEYVQELGGPERCGVVGRGFRAPAANAALANGVAAHALDFDDVTWRIPGHPSAAMLPALLAVCEERGCNGQHLLTSYVLSVEVAAKVGAGITPNHYELGWHATSTMGTLGAAAGVSWLLRLDKGRIRNALGIAASQASGLRQNFGTMTKPLHAGQASRNGIFAASLAEKGFTADQSILESRFGFFNTLCNGSYDSERIVQSLGNPFDVASPGVGIKRYPSCHGTHWALDAMLGLIGDHDLTPDEVEKVHVAIPNLFSHMLIHPRPRTGLEGKFSMQFCMAVALVDRAAGLRQFTDDSVLRSEVQDLIPRVIVETDDQESSSEEPEFSVVTVTLRDGAVLSRSVTKPRGSPEVPLTWDEVVAKYRETAGLALPLQRVEESLAMISHMEALEDVRLLVEKLV